MGDWLTSFGEWPMLARVFFGVGFVVAFLSAAYGVSHRSRHAASSDSGGTGAVTLVQDAAAATVEQRTQGASSPNINISNNVNSPVTINPSPPASPPRRPGAKVEDRISVSKEDGTEWEEVTFWNPGDSATPVFDILILDTTRKVIASFKPPNANRIDPPLPVSIEAGGVRHFKMKLTPAEVHDARWFQYKSERGLSDPVPWAERRRYVYLAARSDSHTTMTITATATVQKLKIRQEYQQHKGGVITKGITFVNDTDQTVQVFDVRVLDESYGEVVNFRPPHGRITPSLPLNVEPHRAIQITVQLTQEQTGRGAWLEWEETGGDKPRFKWTHRDVSVEVPPASMKLDGNPASVSVGGSTADGNADSKQGEGERK